MTKEKVKERKFTTSYKKNKHVYHLCAGCKELIIDIISLQSTMIPAYCDTCEAKDSLKRLVVKIVGIDKSTYGALFKALIDWKNTKLHKLKQRRPYNDSKVRAVEKKFVSYVRTLQKAYTIKTKGV